MSQRPPALRGKRATKPRVVVEVRGGMTYMYADGDVEAITLDYDTDGVDLEQTDVDAEGDRCVVSFGGAQNPRLVQKAFKRFGS